MTGPQAATGPTVEPLTSVTYSTILGGTARGIVQSVDIEKSDIFLPRVTGITVYGEAGMIDGLTRLPEVCFHRLSAGAPSEENWQAVCKAVGAHHG